MSLKCIDVFCGGRRTIVCPALELGESVGVGGMAGDKIQNCLLCQLLPLGLLPGVNEPLPKANVPGHFLGSS